MLKKTMKYVDYDGNERVEDFYFNMTKSELAEMEVSKTGGMQKFIKKIASTNDAKSIVEMFKDVILRSYGERSEDGRRFIKTQELRDSFQQTEAFSELFMEMLKDASFGAEFFKGIIPQSMVPDVEAAMLEIENQEKLDQETSQEQPPSRSASIPQFPSKRPPNWDPSNKR